MSGTLISYLAATLANGGAVPQAVSQANPLPVALSGGIGGLTVAGLFPQFTVADPNPVIVGGRDTATGELRTFQTDPVTGGLLVTGAGSGGKVDQGNPNAGGAGLAWPVDASGFNVPVFQNVASNLNAQVAGDVANAATDSGNPVKVASVSNGTAALPTYTAGQRSQLQADNHGNLRVQACISQVTGNDGISNNNLGAGQNTVTASTGPLLLQSAQYIFNGSSWDRMTRPRTAFRLPSSAASNNAANIKTTAGAIFTISGLVTLAASVCYLKLFDSTGVPNPAALNPLYIFPLSILDGVFSFNLPTQGLYFPTGIGIAIVANPADLDNTAIAAGQITGLSVSFQ